jgi:predicted dehydrogenase
MKLRVGLIGLGKLWESRHRLALRALSDRYEVRAVCEQVAHRAQQAAREFGATAVDGFRALTARDDVDAVLMLGSQWYGPLPIYAACEAGKAVYWAGALDLAEDEIGQVRKCVERSGIAFVAELPRRLAPATIRLKELIATRLGAPRLLFCHHRFPAQAALTNHAEAQAQCLATRELVELVDWCRYVVGSEPTSVFGMHHAATDGPVSDYEMMSLDFSPTGERCSGAVAQISAGRYLSVQWPEAITFRPPAALQVACERGVAFIDLPATLVWFDSAGRHMESLDAERPVDEQLLLQFHRAVVSLVQSVSSLNDAFRSLAIVQASRRSHGVWMRLPVETVNEI